MHKNVKEVGGKPSTQRSRQVQKLKAGTLLNYWRNGKEARVTRAEQAGRTRGEHGSDSESACESRAGVGVVTRDFRPL